jgi:hypothetical protein
MVSIAGPLRLHPFVKRESGTGHGLARTGSGSLEGSAMLWMISIVLILLWLLGVVNSFGGYLHLLLVIAMIAVLLQIIQERRATD